MKTGDVVTLALVALGAYLAWCYFQQPRPRTYYAADELSQVYL